MMSITGTLAGNKTIWVSKSCDFLNTVGRLPNISQSKLILVLEGYLVGRLTFCQLPFSSQTPVTGLCDATLSVCL